mmetsp:Transcript_18789/g.61704  ORF Transcript_18789/g.61704 Transcript_18789/m.61704 type:complete len:395 (-) Transcript_18789:32-1216(-)
MHDSLLDDRGEVGGSVELGGGDGAAVSRKKSSNIVNLWLVNVAVEGEAVGCLRVPRHDPSEAVHRDLLVLVVLDKDLSYSDHRLLVLVQRPVRLDVVQRVRVRGVSVGHGEVDGHRDRELAAVGDVVVQRGVADDVDPVYSDGAWLFGASSRAIVEANSLLLRQLVERGLYPPDHVVLGCWVLVPALELKLLVLLPVAQVLHRHREGLPLGVQVVVDCFRTVHFHSVSILAKLDELHVWVRLPHEAVLVRQLHPPHLHIHHVLVSPALLLRHDRDAPGLLPVGVLELVRQLALDRADDLGQRALYAPDLISVQRLRWIVDVEHVEHKPLLLLEKVLDVDPGLEDRVLAVLDPLSPADLLLGAVGSSLVHDADGVALAGVVLADQIFAGDSEEDM